MESHQSFDEVLPTAAKVDDAAEDVCVTLVLKLLKYSVNGDVDPSATSAITTRYIQQFMSSELLFNSTQNVNLFPGWCHKVR